MLIDEMLQKAINVAAHVGFDLQSIVDKQQACNALYDYIQMKIKNRSLFSEYDPSVKDWYSSYGLWKSICGSGRILHAPS